MTKDLITTNSQSLQVQSGVSSMPTSVSDLPYPQSERELTAAAAAFNAEGEGQPTSIDTSKRFSTSVKHKPGLQEYYQNQLTQALHGEKWKRAKQLYLDGYKNNFFKDEELITFARSTLEPANMEIEAVEIYVMVFEKSKDPTMKVEALNYLISLQYNIFGNYRLASQYILQVRRLTGDQRAFEQTLLNIEYKQNHTPSQILQEKDLDAVYDRPKEIPAYLDTNGFLSLEKEGTKFFARHLRKDSMAHDAEIQKIHDASCIVDKRPRDAIALIDQALTQLPYDDGYYNQLFSISYSVLCEAHLKLGHYYQARRCFQLSYLLDPFKSEKYDSAYYLLQAVDQAEKGRFRLAYESFEAAMRLATVDTSGDIFFVYREVAMKNGDISKIKTLWLHEFSDVLLANKGDFSASLDAIKNKLNREKTKSGIKNEVIDLISEHRNVYLGDYYFLLGDYDQAKSYYSRVINVDIQGNSALKYFSNKQVRLESVSQLRSFHGCLDVLKNGVIKVDQSRPDYFISFGIEKNQIYLKPDRYRRSTIDVGKLNGLYVRMLVSDSILEKDRRLQEMLDLFPDDDPFYNPLIARVYLETARSCEALLPSAAEKGCHENAVDSVRLLYGKAAVLYDPVVSKDELQRVKALSVSNENGMEDDQWQVLSGQATCVADVSDYDDLIFDPSREFYTREAAMDYYTRAMMTVEWRYGDYQKISDIFVIGYQKNILTEFQLLFLVESIYIPKNKNTEAKKLCEAVLSVNPYSPSAHYCLSDYYFYYEGNYEQAQHQLDQIGEAPVFLEETLAVFVERLKYFTDLRHTLRSYLTNPTGQVNVNDVSKFKDFSIKYKLGRKGDCYTLELISKRQRLPEKVLRANSMFVDGLNILFRDQDYQTAILKVKNAINEMPDTDPYYNPLLSFYYHVLSLVYRKTKERSEASLTNRIARLLDVAPFHEVLDAVDLNLDQNSDEIQLTAGSKLHYKAGISLLIVMTAYCTCLRLMHGVNPFIGLLRRVIYIYSSSSPMSDVQYYAGLLEKNSTQQHVLTGTELRVFDRAASDLIDGLSQVTITPEGLKSLVTLSELFQRIHSGLAVTTKTEYMQNVRQTVRRIVLISTEYIAKIRSEILTEFTKGIAVKNIEDKYVVNSVVEDLSIFNAFNGKLTGLSRVTIQDNLNKEIEDAIREINQIEDFEQAEELKKKYQEKRQSLLKRMVDESPEYQQKLRDERFKKVLEQLSILKDELKTVHQSIADIEQKKNEFDQHVLPLKEKAKAVVFDVKRLDEDCSDWRKKLDKDNSHYQMLNVQLRAKNISKSCDDFEQEVKHCETIKSKVQKIEDDISIIEEKQNQADQDEVFVSAAEQNIRDMVTECARLKIQLDNIKPAIDTAAEYVQQEYDDQQEQFNKCKSLYDKLHILFIKNLNDSNWSCKIKSREERERLIQKQREEEEANEEARKNREKLEKKRKGSPEKLSRNGNGKKKIGGDESPVRSPVTFVSNKKVPHIPQLSLEVISMKDHLNRYAASRKEHQDTLACHYSLIDDLFRLFEIGKSSFQNTETGEIFKLLRNGFMHVHALEFDAIVQFAGWLTSEDHENSSYETILTRLKQDQSVQLFSPNRRQLIDELVKKNQELTTQPLYQCFQNSLQGGLSAQNYVNEILRLLEDLATLGGKQVDPREVQSLSPAFLTPRVVIFERIGECLQGLVKLRDGQKDQTARKILTQLYESNQKLFLSFCWGLRKSNAHLDDDLEELPIFTTPHQNLDPSQTNFYAGQAKDCLLPEMSKLLTSEAQQLHTTTSTAKVSRRRNGR